MDMNCSYCAEGKLVDAFGIKIGGLPASKVYLFKEQSHKGRCIVASKFHVSEISELDDGARNAFMDDVCKVARAIHRLFAPAKVNYGAYGDTGHRLHFHLVPKYMDGFEWGGTFEMNPKCKFLSDAEYAELVNMLKKELGL